MLESWSMKKLLAIVVLGLIWSNHSNANPSLKGIEDIKIIVEELHPAAEKCGLSTDKILTSAKYILQNSKFNVVPSDKPAFNLYIQVNLGHHQAGYCYSSARIEVYDFILHKGRYGDVVYYNNSIIMSGGIGSSYGNSVANQIEGMLKELVVAWSEANK